MRLIQFLQLINHSIQIMNQHSSPIAKLIADIDFARPLTATLAILHQTLQRQAISHTSKLALQAYQQICQEYINHAQKRTRSNSAQRKSSKALPEAMLVKVDPGAFAEKQQSVIKLAKRHYLRRLIMLSKVDEEAVKREEWRARKTLQMEMAKFHFRIKIAKKMMKALRQMQEDGKLKTIRANEFLESRQQIILQQYFLAWRDEALMSQDERIYRNQLELNYELLGKIMFLKRLQSAKKKLHCQHEQYQQQTQQFIYRQQYCKMTQFIHKLQKNLERNEKMHNQIKEMAITHKKIMFISLIKTVNKFKVHRASSEEKRQKTIEVNLYPRLFFRRMKKSFELRKVYFKNSKKIIFLAILLEQLKENLLRKGYEYEWMSQLDQNIKFVDSRLGFPYRKRRLLRIFTQFREVLKNERIQMQTVKQMKGGQILKQLIYNYKLSILKQKQQHKLEALQTHLSTNMVEFAITALKQCHTHKKKQESLANYLIISKLKQGMHYLKTFSRSSKFYTTRLSSFLKAQEKNQITAIFHALKTVLLTERVNNRLVEEYHNYTDRVKLQQIFQCLKDYCFSQQLIKKRMRNVSRIRLSQYADQLFYNLKVELYAQTKARLANIAKNQKSVVCLRVSNAFRMIINRFRFIKIEEKMQAQIDKQYELRFKWKMFNLFKVVMQRRQEEKGKTQAIMKKKERRLKELSLDRMLTRLLLALLLRKINAGLENHLQRTGFEALRQTVNANQRSISQYSDSEQSEGAGLTSQFKFASPSLFQSNDIEEE